MRIDILTIFPDYLAPLSLSLLGRARERGTLDLRVHDLRDFTHDRHRTVDDTPYGGGAGMVMRPEPWGEAIDHILEEERAAGRGPGDGSAQAPDGGSPGLSAGSPLLIVPSPAGTRFTQVLARELAVRPWLVFACGRYEGIDQRVADHAASRMQVLPVSLGDYVLNGGEVAAMAMIEAIGRLIPGVVGNPESLLEESHETGLLEYPVYTKPGQWRGLTVPEVLLSGNHARIERWRRDQALARTAAGRPDLLRGLDAADMDEQDLATLSALGWRLADGRLTDG